ncbi:hypothetical protein BCR33DRAFT_766404 [Rhizoclosmatium globosum]|uniref:Uncharacterized protein n=1 Tax=Rhizoclosmatium globosum TaxID=329046 RepID=A0A1Y2C9Y0_9FUNG|nr:hypothetical protein BCR33DRAFT_766404 [Rhizoclosmatium globosum]|eukprot:ORY43707.1 hypothetical protein BCR33DRAFT_766404 [Rhizoclosmatium globosum]
MQSLLLSSSSWPLSPLRLPTSTSVVQVTVHALTASSHVEITDDLSSNVAMSKETCSTSDSTPTALKERSVKTAAPMVLLDARRQTVLAMWSHKSTVVTPETRARMVLSLVDTGDILSSNVGSLMGMCWIGDFTLSVLKERGVKTMDLMGLWDASNIAALVMGMRMTRT